ncbi:hypothetical protein SRHO_G00094870 [Serrasalmus rhombeus]
MEAAFPTVYQTLSHSYLPHLIFTQCALKEQKLFKAYTPPSNPPPIGEEADWSDRGRDLNCDWRQVSILGRIAVI